MPAIPAKILLWTALAALCSLPASAQVRVEDGTEMTPSAEAYLEALRFRGIDAEVAYFDPSRPPPDLYTKETPDPNGFDVDVNLDRDQGTLIINAVSLAVLLGIAYLFLRFGGRFSVSLRADRDAGREVAAVKREGSALGTVPDNLDAIARIEDRRLALVTMAQSALIRALRENGLLLQRSWTARDAMRRLPQDMSHRHALRDLVSAGERVLFGGRDVSEADFQDHLDQIRPLFSNGAG
ncbi:MAG: DUF4129 domain-containing protein [Pseudomonadota bacterium]